MNVLTGPRTTPDELGSLLELTGLTDLPLLHLTDALDMVDADVLYRAAGWESCPLATADVVVAEAYGLTIKDI